MQTVCDKDLCNGCMACVDRCPRHCIKVVDSIFSFNAVKDISLCVNCGLCEKVCPNNVKIEMKSQISSLQGWACDEIRKKSTSGGIATALIRDFINNGGFVAACVFENGEFVFDITNDIKRPESFSGSK